MPQPFKPGDEGLMDSWKTTCLQSMLEGQGSWVLVPVKKAGSRNHKGDTLTGRHRGRIPVLVKLESF